MPRNNSSFVFVLCQGQWKRFTSVNSFKLHDTLKEILRSSPSTEEEKDLLGRSRNLSSFTQPGGWVPRFRVSY